jgi:hypothetical protein
MPDSFLPLGMSTPPEDVGALTDLVRAARRPGNPHTFAVEVGSWAGRTAIAMAGAGALVWCVDTWEGSVGDPVDDTERMVRQAGGPDNVFRVFCRNVGPARLFRSVFPCRGPSALWADVFPYLADLVFIDGDHRYEAVRADIAGWLPKVRPGGVLCGHDCGVFEGVNRAVGEAFPGGVELHGRTLWVHRKP